MVIGTTGLSEEMKHVLRKLPQIFRLLLCKHLCRRHSGLKLVRQVAQVLGEEWDIEIVENTIIIKLMHHLVLL